MDGLSSDDFSESRPINGVRPDACDQPDKTSDESYDEWIESHAPASYAITGSSGYFLSPKRPVDDQSLDARPSKASNEHKDSILVDLFIGLGLILVFGFIAIFTTFFLTLIQ